jgi:hypothetical protein
VLQDKMKRGKTTREEFIRLFSKTSAYIKSLKSIIDGKDKRIKVLERQLAYAKNDEGLHGNWSGLKDKFKNVDLDVMKPTVFKTSSDDAEEYQEEYSMQVSMLLCSWIQGDLNLTKR